MKVAWDYRLYRDGANREIKAKQNMLNSCSSNCKMLQKTQIEIFLTTGDRFVQSDAAQTQDLLVA